MNMQTATATTGVNPLTAKDDHGDSRQSSCLLLALDGPAMLVPRTVVAEVLKYSLVGMTRDGESGLDFFDWRGCRVPLAASRVGGDALAATIDDDARIVILYGLTSPQKLPFYGVIANKSPQLLQVGADDLEALQERDLDPGELMRVIAKGAPAYIPRTDHFERSLLKLLQLVEH